MNQNRPTHHCTGSPCTICFPQYNFGLIGDIKASVPVGWECPKCGTVYAPNWFSCDNCGPKNTNTKSTLEVKP